MKTARNISNVRVRAEQAFTLRDLIVLVAVLSLLVLTHLAAVSMTQGDRNSLICRSNLGRLTLAWHLYAEDNGGLFPSAGATSPPRWDGGEWLSLPSVTAAEYRPELSVEKSPLARYVNDNRVWRCPADFVTAYDPSLGRHVPRVRSYSMNNWMGGPEWGPWAPGMWMVFTKISDLGSLAPGQALVLLDEHEQSIDDGYFAIDMTGYPDQPSQRRLVEFPADRHDNGANLSFADGHVEQWIWKDRRTHPQRTNQRMLKNVASPNNPDILRLQQVATRRR